MKLKKLLKHNIKPMQEIKIFRDNVKDTAKPAELLYSGNVEHLKGKIALELHLTSWITLHDVIIVYVK